MISHQHKCIFIHIPKCAGTSIEKVFNHFSNYEGRGGQDHRTLRMIERPRFKKELFYSSENILDILREYKMFSNSSVNPSSKKILTSQEYREYFKFSIVRNPWSRAFSWYSNVIRDPIHSKNYNISNDISLHDFLKIYAATSYPLRPQTYWLKNLGGKIKLDYIGKFEKIEETFNMIQKTFDMGEVNFPHEKKTNNKDYRDIYDDASIDLIKKLYHTDIDAFDYTFEDLK